MVSLQLTKLHYRLKCTPGEGLLKGALMLQVWHSPEFRPTMDIDLLGRTSNVEDDLIAQVQDILAVTVEADGLAFDPDSIRAGLMEK